MRAGWLATVAASSSTFSKRVRPTWRSATVTVSRPVALVELDEEHLAGPVLVEGDRLRARRRRRRSRCPALPVWVECQWPSAR